MKMFDVHFMVLSTVGAKQLLVFELASGFGLRRPERSRLIFSRGRRGYYLLWGPRVPGQSYVRSTKLLKLLEVWSPAVII